MKTLAKLDEACRARDVALVALDTLGLVGTVRLSRTEHRVLEAKPEETDFDLRVNKPWPALMDFARRFAPGGDIGDALTDAQRAHIPWAVTLVNVVEGLGMRDAPPSAWTADRRAAAKAAIKAAFLSRARDAPSADDAEAAATAAALGDAVLPENATEALAAARHAWKAPGAVPPSLKETLSDPKLDALETNAPSFWFLLAGLRAFLRGDGGDEASKLAALPSDAVMPLEGSIPDMTSTTEWYVELQRLYREKADADADAVLRHTRFFLRAAGASEEAVTREEARFFCRHAAHARAVRWRSVADELAWADGAGAALAAKLADPDATVAWCAARYVVARAVDVYRETRGRYPGAPLSVEKNDAHMMRDDAGDDDDVCDVEGDTQALRSIVETTLKEIGAEAERVNGGVVESMVVEAVRCAGGEPHTVAAVLGGVGAQEVIKLVTGQFEPEAHTLVYDAAKAVTAAVL
jgi:amyloid beta precursor protein binding protein 1